MKREKTTGCFSVQIIFGLILMWLPVASQAEVDTSLADSLRSTFNEQGWQEQRSEDGSVIYRQPNDKAKLAKKAAAAKEGQRKQQLADSLNARGWQVDWQSDGSLVLKPKAKSTSIPARPSEAPATQAQNELATALSDSNYWRTERGKDGELLFYPLATAPVVEAAKGDPATQASCEGYYLPGTRALLPIDRGSKAKQLAYRWLDATGLSRLRVGSVRRMASIYMVLLIEDRMPYRPKHLLAIRASDGQVIHLDWNR